MRIRESVLNLEPNWWQQDTSHLRKELGIEPVVVDLTPPPAPRLRGMRSMKRPERIEDLPKLLTFREAMARCRVSTTTFYEMLKKKTFVPVSVGGKRLIPETQLVNYLWKKIHEADQKVS